MQRVPLNSRLLSSVAYDRDTQTLHVWRQDKRHVMHGNISEAVYNNLVEAESAGFYYTAYIARPDKSGSHRQSTGLLFKLVAACLISMLLVSLSATSIASLS